MLTPDENELLTKTGPGTPMGAMLRRYWVPALLSEELPEPDCPPVRAKLLGEELVAFRDSAGRVGLLDAYCAHRRANLFWGRNEECGLRCVYHGWKYDVDGNCVDMPNEPPGIGSGMPDPYKPGPVGAKHASPSFRDKIHQLAYPCQERGGVVWAYMGPPDLRPPLPELEWTLVPDDQRYATKRLEECNWLQAMEGGIDSSHISFLHRDVRRNATGQELAKLDTAPVFQVASADFGLLIAARRTADDEHFYWRITPWIMPWYTMIPPYGDAQIGGHAWAPIDDNTCWTYHFVWHPARPLNEKERDEWKHGQWLYSETIPGTYRPKANMSNDYFVDRGLQKSRALFSGIRGTSTQDMAIQESMGPLVDRSREHLGTSDTAIIAARRRLLNAVRACAAGQDPPGLDPASQHVRPTSILLPKNVPFAEGSKEAIQAKPGVYAGAV